MIKKILVMVLGAALVLAPTYSFARRGADDGAGHEANHGGGHEQNHGGNGGHEQNHGGNGGHEQNHGGNSGGNTGGHHDMDDAAGHDLNDNDTDDHLPPPTPAP